MTGPYKMCPAKVLKNGQNWQCGKPGTMKGRQKLYIARKSWALAAWQHHKQQFEMQEHAQTRINPVLKVFIIE